MPVILSPDHYDLWLAPEIEEPKTLHELFDPFPDKGMNAYPVSTYVNSPRNNDEECVEPLEY